MSYSKEKLLEVAGNTILSDKINGNPNFGWLDIVGIPQRPSQITDPLFFATHSEGEGGWDHGFDRRPYAVKAARENDWHLAVDQSLDAENTNHLKVTSLDELSEKLYEAARAETNPYVIGVTGSVGKTTTVAFIEHLIKSSGIEVARFYSKRLTPLSVMTHYVNRVDKDTPIVVMEYSAYLKDHIAELSAMLSPNIAFLLNIYDTHIAEGMFSDKRDIFDSKIRIKPQSGAGFVNKKILSELQVGTPIGWTPFNVATPNFENNLYLPPTLRSAELFTVGKILAIEMGFTDSQLETAYATFIPQERRIEVCYFEGKRIFFHGETSGGSRLWSWFETVDGSSPWLFVEEVKFAEEDPDGFRNLLEKVFSSDKTLVLDTPSNRDKLPVNARFVNEETFRKYLSRYATGYIIYHKALATRLPDFKPGDYINQNWG